MDRRFRHIACYQDKLDSNDITKLFLAASLVGEWLRELLQTPLTTCHLLRTVMMKITFIMTLILTVHSSDHDTRDYFSEEEDLDKESQSLLDDEPYTPDTSEPHFSEDVLTNFRYIGKGPIDWEDKNIDYLVSEFL